MTDIRHTNIMEALGRIHSDIATIQNDIDWVKKNQEEIKKTMEEKAKSDKDRFAAKYIEKIVWIVTTTLIIGVLNQIVNLIPKAYALIF